MIEDHDLGEASLEEGAANAVEAVDGLGDEAEGVLAEAGELAVAIVDAEMNVIAELADAQHLDAWALLLRLGEPETDDVASLPGREKTEATVVAADGDVEKLTGLSSSRPSHREREVHVEDQERSVGRPRDRPGSSVRFSNSSDFRALSMKTGP